MVIVKKVKKQNKRGMLLASEVLKMVLSVLAIGVLVYLLASLYYNNIEGKKKDEAIDLVSRMGEVIERIENLNNVTNESVDQIIPSEWSIFSFTESELKPNSCSGINCFCVCDEVWIDVFDRQVKECSEDGVCVIQENLMKFDAIEILDAGRTSILIYEYEGFIGVKKI